MGDPEDEAQQPAPDSEQPGQSEQPDQEGAQSQPEPQPEQPTQPDSGGVEPDITWEG